MRAISNEAGTPQSMPDGGLTGDPRHSFRFIPHPAAVTYLKLASHLRRNEAGRDRPKCVHLAAGPGAGKTRLQKHYLEQVAPQRDQSGPRQRDVIYVEAPYDGHHGKLARSIIDACLPGGYPVRRPSALCEVALTLIASSGVRQILIDEAGNLLNAGRSTQQQSLAFIKAITNRGVTISIASTMNLVNVLAADEQLQSRFTRVEIPMWAESESFRSFLASIELELRLPQASGLSDQAIVRWLVSRGCCTTSRVLEVICNAKRIADSQGLARIDIRLLDIALSHGYVGEGTRHGDF